MKKRQHEDDMPMGKLTRVKDFLPPPHELNFGNDKVKVTMELSRSSVNFFKDAAIKHGGKYQNLIRQVLDYYAAHYA